MRIYFDACCLNRLTDDQKQARVKREADAIEQLLGFATEPQNVWVSSFVLAAEISRNPNLDRREDVESLVTLARHFVELNGHVVSRGRELQGMGFSAFDALHLACSEYGQVDVFLSTDDRLIRKAQRYVSKLAVRVLNPVSLLEELRNADGRND